MDDGGPCRSSSRYESMLLYATDIHFTYFTIGKYTSLLFAFKLVEMSSSMYANYLRLFIIYPIYFFTLFMF